jgi:hypothetical protein
MSSKMSQFKSFWGSTFMKLKKMNFPRFLRKGKHWCIPPPIEFSLYNIYSMFLIVHLRIGVY